MNKARQKARFWRLPALAALAFGAAAAILCDVALGHTPSPSAERLP